MVAVQSSAEQVSQAGWYQPLIRVGEQLLVELSPLLAATDPQGTVTGPSRMLCAALGLLAQECYAGLGGQVQRDQVGRAAALLSLLTKIDDQVIDSPAFHGGMGAQGRDASDLCRRLHDYLWPTLRSLRAAKPESLEPRCIMAAQLGQELRQLSAHSERLEHLLDVIEMGWGIQVDAVVLLSSHPADVTVAQAREITKKISGAWLLMIALVGTLPADALRAMSSAEEAAFFDWGALIQSADALADLEKDVADGMCSSLPGRLMYHSAPDAMLAACASGDADALYRLCAQLGADLECMPDWQLRQALRRTGPGAVGELLAWIHHFLTWRYLSHPSCQRAVAAAGAFSPYLTPPGERPAARTIAPGVLFGGDACSAR